MTGIELSARHIRLDWLLNFTKLTVSVDGKAQVLPWGTHVIPAAAGTHTLDVSYGYLGKQRGRGHLGCARRRWTGDPRFVLHSTVVDVCERQDEHHA